MLFEYKPVYNFGMAWNIRRHGYNFGMAWNISRHGHASVSLFYNFKFKEHKYLYSQDSNCRYDTRLKLIIIDHRTPSMTIMVIHSVSDIL
jgi:hypothetical protein